MLAQGLQYARPGAAVCLGAPLFLRGRCTVLAKGLHERYGDDALRYLESDPFQLARDVRGIGFRVADRIAQALGLATDSPTRVDAGVTHCGREATVQGHSAVKSLVLRDRACDLLRVDEDAIAESLSRLLGDGFLEVEPAEGEEIYIFDPELRAAEVRVAEKVAALALAEREVWEVPDHPESLGAAQRAAVEAALMVAGAASVYAYPPGAANTCKNWNWCMLSLFVAFTGAIAAVDGIVVNLSQHAPVKTRWRA